jgi:hypothetical protein
MSVPARAPDPGDERAWATTAGEGDVMAAHSEPRFTKSEAPAERDPDAVVVPREMAAEVGPPETKHGRLADPVAAHQVEVGEAVNDPLGELDRQPAIFAYPPGRGLPGSPTPSRSIHGPISDQQGDAQGRPGLDEGGPSGRYHTTESRGDPESDDAGSGAAAGAAAGALAGAPVGGPIGMVPGAIAGAVVGAAAEGADDDDEVGHEVDDRERGVPRDASA